jgi:hypothetical protein
MSKTCVSPVYFIRLWYRSYFICGIFRAGTVSKNLLIYSSFRHASEGSKRFVIPGWLRATYVSREREREREREKAREIESGERKKA